MEGDRQRRRARRRGRPVLHHALPRCRAGQRVDRHQGRLRELAACGPVRHAHAVGGVSHRGAAAARQEPGEDHSRGGSTSPTGSAAIPSSARARRK